jgi:aldose 1-epimerase
MSDRIRLETDKTLVEVLPRLGGGITAFDLKRRGERVPVFRPWTGEWENPRALGCSPLVPWFNRISGGGFSFGDAFYPIAPNDPMEAVPIHGDGWTSRWEIVERAPLRVALRLRSRVIPPFDYEATQVLSLQGATFEMELSVTHRGDKPVPYGLGQHPWFVRTPGVTLEARAAGVWLEQPPEFPEKTEPEPIPDKWDFSAPRSLPDDFIDNGFAGWDNRARIDWADRDIAVRIEADAATRYYHVYSPDKDCDFFCFEPVTHANNAFAKPGRPEANDLRVLQPGEETSLKVRFTGELR